MDSVEAEVVLAAIVKVAVVSAAVVDVEEISPRVVAVVVSAADAVDLAASVRTKSGSSMTRMMKKARMVSYCLGQVNACEQKYEILCCGSAFVSLISKMFIFIMYVHFTFIFQVLKP